MTSAQNHMCNESIPNEARALHGASLSSRRRHPGPWCSRRVSKAISGTLTPLPFGHQRRLLLFGITSGLSESGGTKTGIRLGCCLECMICHCPAVPNVSVGKSGFLDSNRTFLSAAACTMIYSCRGGRLPVPCLSLGSLLSMLCLSLSCLLPVPCLCPACLLGISCLCSACLLPACCLCSACLLKVSCLCSACLLSACCLCPACLFGVSCLCSACFLSACDDDDDDDDQRRRSSGRTLVRNTMVIRLPLWTIRW